MLDNPTTIAVIDALSAGRTGRVVLLLEGISQRGVTAEVESFRLLFWWLRSYLLAAQFCPDLSQRELNARNYLCRTVEVCIIKGLNETLPKPGLSWSPERRERESTRRAPPTAGPPPGGMWKRFLNVVCPPPKPYDSKILEALKAEILEALDREGSAYADGPITEEVLRTMQLNHMLRISWKI